LFRFFKKHLVFFQKSLDFRRLVSAQIFQCDLTRFSKKPCFRTHQETCDGRVGVKNNRKRAQQDLMLDVVSAPTLRRRAAERELQHGLPSSHRCVCALSSFGRTPLSSTPRAQPDCTRSSTTTAPFGSSLPGARVGPPRS
jgi:hypothetical protein